MRILCGIIKCAKKSWNVRNTKVDWSKRQWNLIPITNCAISLRPDCISHVWYDNISLLKLSCALLFDSVLLFLFLFTSSVWLDQSIELHSDIVVYLNDIPKSNSFIITTDSNSIHSLKTCFIFSVEMIGNPVWCICTTNITEIETFLTFRENYSLRSMKRNAENAKCTNPPLNRVQYK